MSEIGKWGKFKFEVGTSKTKTFDDMKSSVSSKWKQHGIPQNSPKTEFLGRDQYEASMKVVLSAYLGISPYKTLKELEDYCCAGATEYLIVGGRKIGKGKFYIEKISGAYDIVTAGGKTAQITVDIKFKEYR